MAVFVLFNAGVAAIAFAVTEAYLFLHQPEDPTYSEPTYSDGYRVIDDVLGVVPVKGFQAHSVRFIGGLKVYDVIYTIDSKGLRIGPPVNGSTTGCILFFGDSFTFGEGLQDTETLPYQVGIQSGRSYRTFNFGFHGYGPHQMLAAIETGLVHRLVDCHPDYAIYSAIPNHVARVAGKVPFGKHSVRYQVDANGAVRPVGRFDDHQKVSSPLHNEMEWQLRKSALYRALVKREGRASAEDIRLLIAIVGRSRDLLASEYPGIKFHVLLWWNWKSEEPIYRGLGDGLRRINIPVHLVENILPGYAVESSKYSLSPYDPHPNALANRILASYVLTSIVSPPFRLPVF